MKSFLFRFTVDLDRYEYPKHVNMILLEAENTEQAKILFEKYVQDNYTCNGYTVRRWKGIEEVTLYDVPEEEEWLEEFHNSDLKQ